MARTAVVEPYDVIVIGGGASGLACALSSARAGAHTAVIERDVACGLPILATGNGRCNLSNALLHPTHYRNPEAARTVMGATPEENLAAWFRSLGLMTCREGNLLYPYSKRAESVRDALLAACEREGVVLVNCCEVVRAQWQATDAASTRPAPAPARPDARSDNRASQAAASPGAPAAAPSAQPAANTPGAWKLDILAPTKPLRAGRARDPKSELRALRKALVVAPKRSLVLTARTIVLAPGGSSEAVCQLFNLSHLDEEPVLCPVACTPLTTRSRAGADLLARLDGLRVEAGLSLVRDGNLVWREQGEVLFRTYGISGVVVFNLSRRVQPNDQIDLDLFPDTPEPDLVDAFRARERVVGLLGPRTYRWFDGVLAPALGRVLVLLGEGTAEGCAHAAKHLSFRATGRTEVRSAQVRRGGIPFDAVELPRLAVTQLPAEASTHKNVVAPAGTLFACGEALDMDADCGGYNLAWAWLSGQQAGRSAAQAARAAKTHA